MATACWVRRRDRPGRGVQSPRAGQDHRADQQAGLPTGPCRGGYGPAVLPDREAAVARLRRRRSKSGRHRPRRQRRWSRACACRSRWRARLARACAAHVRLGPATLLLYDVTTLYFETDEGDGFREPGFSKERRLEPQITVGQLTDGAGFPLMVHAFEGNRAETSTMLTVLRAFLDAHRLSDVTVVADAGMVSEANKRAIEQAGLSFILGARVLDVPYVVAAWRNAHPDAEIPDGHVFIQPWPAGPADNRRDHTFFYQYKADRARRTLRGIDNQVAKAENAVAGKQRSNETGTYA
ncbi:IS1634 family transposase [Salinispora pacifica]